MRPPSPKAITGDKHLDLAAHKAANAPSEVHAMARREL
jgi:hypothetical protein